MSDFEQDLLLEQPQQVEDDSRRRFGLRQLVAVGLASVLGIAGSARIADAEDFDDEVELYIYNPDCDDVDESADSLEHGVVVRGLNSGNYPWGGILQFVISRDSDSDNLIDRNKGEIPGIINNSGTSASGKFYSRINGERNFTADKIEIIASGQGVVHRFENINLSYSCDLPVGEIPIGSTIPNPIPQPVLPEFSICATSKNGQPGEFAVVNITNTDVQGMGFGSLRDSDGVPIPKRPKQYQYSNANFGPDQPPNPNLAVVQVGSDGEYCYDQGPAGTHVILDELATLPVGNLSFDPYRVLDTRQP